MTEERTGVIVVVPEAEDLVGPWRRVHDGSAAKGVPAHVTLLFPLRPAAVVEATIDEVLAELGAVAATVAPQAFHLAHVGVFPSVTWLAPEPASLFRGLTQSLMARFPDCPPYGGEFAEPVPHLTVIDHNSGADGTDDTDDAHRDFVAAATPVLPITARLEELRLMVEGPDGTWSTRATVPFTGRS